MAPERAIVAPMILKRPIVALVAALIAAAPAFAAELPSAKKAKAPPESAKRCSIGGMSGVLAANGVCVKLSGYISAGVTASPPR